MNTLAYRYAGFAGSIALGPGWGFSSTYANTIPSGYELFT